MLREGYARVVLPALLALVLVGCGQSASTSQAEPTQPAPTASQNPYGILDIDPPGADESVLSIVAKDGQSQEFTLGALEALGATEITIFEPFIREQQTFVGVSLETLVREVGIDEASTLMTVALNDYRYPNTVSAFVESDALIAYRVDGRSIGYDEGGPIRIVFPAGTPMFTLLDAWNWSLKELREQ
jgi:hypothetical protein